MPTQPDTRAHAALSAPAVRVLAAYRLLAGRLGVAPTVRELAREVGLGPTTVHHHLRRLEYAGEIRRPVGARSRRRPL